MEKSLEQIQQENRKFILEAIHGCSYEEALKKELGFGCEVIARIWGTLRLTTINNLTCCLDREYGDYLRKNKIEQAFRIHNTGSPTGTTHNSRYVRDGLKHIEYFKIK